MDMAPFPQPEPASGVSRLDRETVSGVSPKTMVKLVGLIEGMARALQIEPARVRTAAAQLRKHKLITTGPRGPGAPDMKPEDATNLLLALMYDGELASAHEHVARLREATFVSSEVVGVGSKELRGTLAPHRFLRSAEGEPQPVGYVLDTMLYWWLEGGSIEEEGETEDGDLYAINISFTVSSPGYRAQLFIDAHETLWTLSYEWKPPEQVAYEAAAPTEGFDMRTRWDALKGPYMSASRMVGEDSLTEIVDCLRGRPWEDLGDEPAADEASA